MRKRRSASTPRPLRQCTLLRAAVEVGEERELAPDATDRLAGLPGPDRVALRIDEVAASTGLSESFVRGLIRKGELTSVKVRSVPLVLVADRRAFLEARRRSAADEGARIARELEASLRSGKE